MRPLRTETFRAMGTGCAIGVTAASGDERRARRTLAAARREVERCEQVLTRFDAASDLSRLNAAAGGWLHVDGRLVEALHLASRMRDVTGGLFDPTVLPALVAAGYDRSFDELVQRAPRPLPGWRAGAEFAADTISGAAYVAPGAAVDLGGIGKGFSAVRALWAMRDAWPGLPGGLVDLGGDIAVWGTTPDGGPWRVGVADPRGTGSQLCMLGLEVGGVATSGRDRRRFGPNRSLHHLIDPGTGTSAVAGPLAVTVVAEDAGEAEGYATALAISDVRASRRLLSGRDGVAALVVHAVGEPVPIGRLPVLAPELRITVRA
jgi:thiamine biosynthesis lipoprotein